MRTIHGILLNQDRPRSLPFFGAITHSSQGTEPPHHVVGRLFQCTLPRGGGESRVRSQPFTFRARRARNVNNTVYRSGSAFRSGYFSPNCPNASLRTTRPTSRSWQRVPTK